MKNLKNTFSDLNFENENQKNIIMPNKTSLKPSNANFAIDNNVIRSSIFYYKVDKIKSK